MFKVRPFESRTLSWWNVERDNIDFKPPYQRSSRIWSPADKALLVDSILNEFDIPKLYLADFSYADSSLNEKRKQFAVIDGKQRFEAIFDFFDGKLTLDSAFVFYADPTLNLAGLSYKDISKRYAKVARIFDNFNLSVMSVITDDESKINELFVRLNRSKPLTGAELRNAMRGEVPGLIRDLTSHQFFVKKIRFGTSRAQDKSAAAKLLLTEFRGKFVETKKKQIDELVDEGVQSEAKTLKRTAKRVVNVLDQMDEVFLEKDPLLRSQGPIVLYYWLVRSHSAQHKDKIREFLVQFDRARNDPAQDDSELLQYNILHRSINNAISQVNCFAILEKRFMAFVKL